MFSMCMLDYPMSLLLLSSYFIHYSSTGDPSKACTFTLWVCFLGRHLLYAYKLGQVGGLKDFIVSLSPFVFGIIELGLITY